MFTATSFSSVDGANDVALSWISLCHALLLLLLLLVAWGRCSVAVRLNKEATAEPMIVQFSNHKERSILAHCERIY